MQCHESSVHVMSHHKLSIRAIKLFRRKYDRMDRLEYLILKTLQQNCCNEKTISMTITEIMDCKSDDEGSCLLGSRSTIYRKLKNLLKQNYIKRGMNDDHAHSFYLDKKSLDLLTNKNKEEN